MRHSTTNTISANTSITTPPLTSVTSLLTPSRLPPQPCPSHLKPHHIVEACLNPFLPFPSFMVNVAHGHFREVWVSAAGVPDAPPGSRHVKKWMCRHCELIQGEAPKYYSITTSPTSRMVHVKEKHDNAPPPPRVRPASSSSPPPDSNAVALLSPPLLPYPLPPSSLLQRSDARPTINPTSTPPSPLSTTVLSCLPSLPSSPALALLIM